MGFKQVSFWSGFLPSTLQRYSTTGFWILVEIGYILILYKNKNKNRKKKTKKQECANSYLKIYFYFNPHIKINILLMCPHCVQSISFNLSISITDEIILNSLFSIICFHQITCIALCTKHWQINVFLWKLISAWDIFSPTLIFSHHKVPL